MVNKVLSIHFGHYFKHKEPKPTMEGGKRRKRIKTDPAVNMIPVHFYSLQVTQQDAVCRLTR